jgi:hypothetical protein
MRSCDHFVYFIRDKEQNGGKHEDKEKQKYESFHFVFLFDPVHHFYIDNDILFT